jgi:hypothetical protein
LWYNLPFLCSFFYLMFSFLVISVGWTWNCLYVGVSQSMREALWFHCVNLEIKHENCIRFKFTHSAYWLTNPMGLSPSCEANSCSANQDIPRTLQNPNVHYHVQNTPALFPILSQINPIHTLTFYLFEIHLSIILPSATRIFYWSIFFWFPYQNFVCTSLTCLIHIWPISSSLIWPLE